MENGLEINKRPIKTLMTEYLKDPGIKVRIHACYLLLKLGNINALKSITDMMTIKNKNIQRDIILLFSNLKSIEFGYFLISLLKNEYAISGDIVSYLTLLPETELKEIDHFISNIFKKNEFINVKEESPIRGEAKPQPIDGFSEGNQYILNIEVNNLREIINSLSIIEIIILNQQINKNAISEIIKTKGILTSTINGKIMAVYKDPTVAAGAALSIYNNFIRFNSHRLPAHRINVFLHIFSQNIKAINDDIINLNFLKLQHLESLPVYNRIIIDEDTKNFITNAFYIDPLPDFEFSKCKTDDRFHEIIWPINFLDLSKAVLNDLSVEISKRQKKEAELETELRQKQKQQNKSPIAIAYGQALDDLGRILKDDLNEVNKYIQKRTTDRELLANVQKMLSNVYKRFFVEKSKIFSDIE